MVYKYKGFHYSVDAQIVGEELEKIEKEKGSVTSKDVVDRARPKDSPLHPLFEWDDKKAAEKWRLHSASQLICAIVTVEEEKPTRAFVSIVEKAPANEGIYANIKKAMSDAQTRDVVLRNALGELKAFKAKYNSLSELAAIFAEIDKVIDATD